MRYMRYKTCMALFQRWRRLTGRTTHEVQVSDHDKATIKEIKEAMIRERLQEMRPDHTYGEIADTLGITKKSLWEKRKEYNITDL